MHNRRTRRRLSSNQQKNHGLPVLDIIHQSRRVTATLLDHFSPFFLPDNVYVPNITPTVGMCLRPVPDDGIRVIVCVYENVLCMVHADSCDQTYVCHWPGLQTRQLQCFDAYYILSLLPEKTSDVVKSLYLQDFLYLGIPLNKLHFKDRYRMLLQWIRNAPANPPHVNITILPMKFGKSLSPRTLFMDNTLCGLGNLQAVDYISTDSLRCQLLCRRKWYLSPRVTFRASRGPKDCVVLFSLGNNDVPVSFCTMRPTNIIFHYVKQKLTEGATLFVQCRLQQICKRGLNRWEWEILDIVPPGRNHCSRQTEEQAIKITTQLYETDNLMY